MKSFGMENGAQLDTEYYFVESFISAQFIDTRFQQTKQNDSFQNNSFLDMGYLMQFKNSRVTSGCNLSDFR